MEKFIQEFGLTELKDYEILFHSINIPSQFEELIKRNILRLGKNISALEKRKKYFILYQFYPTTQKSLCIKDLVQIDMIKNLFRLLKCPIIIQILDDEASTWQSFSKNQVDKSIKEMLNQIVGYMIFDIKEIKDNVHIVKSSTYKLFHNEYETLVSEYKMKAPFSLVKQFYPVSESDIISKIDYPCYNACSPAGEIFTKSLSDITKESQCIIVDEINQMPRYAMSYDAAEKMSFLPPVIFLYENVPHLTGVKGKKCFEGEEMTLLTDDSQKELDKKLKKFGLSGSKGNGSMEDHKRLGGDVDNDVSCTYLNFLEKDSKVLNEKIEEFRKGNISCGGIKNEALAKINELFSIVKKNSCENVNDFYLD